MNQLKQYRKSSIGNLNSMIDEIDTLIIKNKQSVEMSTSPISIIDSYIQTSDLSNTGGKLATFKEGLINRTKSMPLFSYESVNHTQTLPFPVIKDTFKQGDINRSRSMPLERKRGREVIPISLIDDYIQSSDFADTAGNLGIFRQVLILRSRVKQRLLDSQISKLQIKGCM
jgi:hypothetical protein